MTKLLIVESPTKVKTISKFLGKEYNVISTVGHFRDLPKSKLGVDIENDFEPAFDIIEGKEKVIREIKSRVAEADEVFLAPDPDREGEAIAWHVAEELGKVKKGAKPYKRVVFNEITKKAVTKAMGNAREIDYDLVDAYKARRVLDRLVGYKISPVLWRKVKRGLSAGRVQSVAVRLICEREKEIQAFTPEEYWELRALFETAKGERFIAKLAKIGGEDFRIASKEEMDGILADLEKGKFNVDGITDKEFSRRPPPPFTTSTLQQEAARKFGWTGKRTMQIAQQLYEGVEIEGSSEGLITYMRTDSVRISEEGLEQARAAISKSFDAEYLPEKPNFFSAKSGSAVQDAHEAIRPTQVTHSPDGIKKYLKPDQLKLYNLIWMRFVACQMAAAKFSTKTADITSDKYLFRASDTLNLFPGFLKLYDPRSGERLESKEDDEADKDEKLPLPASLKEGDKLSGKEFHPTQHFTKPPPRFNDASLVKTLEENGIGRPSTYAAIIDTIITRGYIVRENKSFMPTEWAFSVTDLMKTYFEAIVDVGFTAEMELKLDKVEDGSENWRHLVGDFWKTLEVDIETANGDDKRFKPEPIETEHVCELCGNKMYIRQGRFGKFLGCSNFPECKNTKPLDANGEIAERSQNQAVKTGDTCPDCKTGELVVRRSKFGTQFVACSAYPKCKFARDVQTKCPKCSGDLEKRMMPNKRKVYVCKNEPDCDFKLWGSPLFEKCDACGYFLAERRVKGQKEQQTFCSNPSCENHSGILT